MRGRSWLVLGLGLAAAAIALWPVPVVTVRAVAPERVLPCSTWSRLPGTAGAS